MYNKPRQFSESEVDTAVEHIKTRNPGLWSELVSLERQRAAIHAVWPTLVKSLNETNVAKNPSELAQLIVAVRSDAVAEAARH